MSIWKKLPATDKTTVAKLYRVQTIKNQLQIEKKRKKIRLQISNDYPEDPQSDMENFPIANPARSAIFHDRSRVSRDR